MMEAHSLVAEPQPTLSSAANPSEVSVLIVTGMSGAGITTALKALEDVGYDCIEHLPLRLLDGLLRGDDGSLRRARRPVAVGVDVRTRDFGVDAFLEAVARLRGDAGIALHTVFLYCDDEELRRRYSATRHRHPMAADLPLTDGIARERQLLSPLRKTADHTIDTTGLAPGDLKQILQQLYMPSAQRTLTVHVVSFSFRSGLPRDADLVFDVRFLANPYYHASLRALTGRDAAVREFVREDPALPEFLAGLFRLLHPLLPRYLAEGKSYLTIAVGCTGGRHRSVFVAEQIAEWLREEGQRVQVHHRDLDRSGDPRPTGDSLGTPSA